MRSSGMSHRWPIGLLLLGPCRASPIGADQELVFNLSSGFTYRAGPDLSTIAVAYQLSWGGR